MKLEDVLREIEGPKFAAEANFASGSKAFHGGLRNHRVFRGLVELMKEPNVPQAVFRRMVELASRPVQLPFENPYDTALTTYLTALDLNSPELVERGAEAVSKAPNCWWAREMSLRVLERAHQGQMALHSSQLGMNPNTLGETVHALLEDAVAITASLQGYDVNASIKLGATNLNPYRVIPSGRRTVIRYRRRRHRNKAAAA